MTGFKNMMLAKSWVPWTPDRKHNIYKGAEEEILGFAKVRKINLKGYDYLYIYIDIYLLTVYNGMFSYVNNFNRSIPMNP